MELWRKLTVFALSLIVGLGAPLRESLASEDAEVEKTALIREKTFNPIPGYVMLGAGAALLLASIGTGAAALKLNGDLEDECPEARCFAPYHDDVDRLETLAALTDAFIPVGLVLVASGALVLVMTHQTEKKYGERKQAASEERPVRFTGTGISWRF